MYTVPQGNEADFQLAVYTVPQGDAVDFELADAPVITSKNTQSIIIF